MEENTDSKRKTVSSIPANYISIHHLKERWIKEKERKQKEEEEEERRRQQLVEEQQRIEEDLKKSEVKRIREVRSDIKHWRKNLVDGGEARCTEKMETAAIGNERGEDTVLRDEGSLDRKRRRRKRCYSKKKKKNQDVDVEELVVFSESIAPLPEYIATENNTPVKDQIRVYRKNSKEKKSVDGGEARFPEKEEPAAIGKERGEDAAPRDEGLPEKKKRIRKWYDSRKSKKKNQDVAVEENVVVCRQCGSIASIASLPEYIATENNMSVKDEIRVYRKNSKEKKSVDGGEGRCAEKKEPAAIGYERGEDAATRDEGLPERKKEFKKRNKNKKKKKKKNQDVAIEENIALCASIEPLQEYTVTENNTPVKDEIRVYAVPREEGLPERKKKFKKQWKKTNQDVAVKEDVVVCESTAPLPEYIVTVDNTPVKDEIRVNRKKGGKPKGKKSDGTREEAVTDATVIQKQFEDLSIKTGKEKREATNLKAQTRTSNQMHDLPPRRVRMPIKDVAIMVWVKKGHQSERGGDGIEVA